MSPQEGHQAGRQRKHARFAVLRGAGGQAALGAVGAAASLLVQARRLAQGIGHAAVTAGRATQGAAYDRGPFRGSGRATSTPTPLPQFGWETSDGSLGGATSVRFSRSLFETECLLRVRTVRTCRLKVRLSSGSDEARVSGRRGRYGVISFATCRSGGSSECPWMLSLPAIRSCLRLPSTGSTWGSALAQLDWPSHGSPTHRDLRSSVGSSVARSRSCSSRFSPTATRYGELLAGRGPKDPSARFGWRCSLLRPRLSS